MGKRRRDGIWEGEKWFHAMKFIGPEGERADAMHVPCETASDASAELEKLVKKAVKTLERGPNIHRDGKTVGERVLLLYPAREAGQTFYMLLWTDGPVLHSISSKSREDVLAIEDGSAKFSTRHSD